MIYKYLFYISISLVLISCGENDKALSEAATISDSEVNISTPAIDETNEVIDNDDIDDSDIGREKSHTNENNEVADNDIDDSDPGRENTNTNENTVVIGNDIDDSDIVLLLN